MNNKGFTLIEMMIVTLMVGILSAIAVPSWLAFTTNQRLSTATDRVLLSVRAAQSEAKRTKKTQLPQPAEGIGPTVQVAYPIEPLRFNYQGLPQVTVPYRINISITGSTMQRCVVVRTILGATATGKNATECTTLATP